MALKTAIMIKGSVELEGKLERFGVVLDMRGITEAAARIVQRQAKQRHFRRGTKLRRRSKASAPLPDILTSRSGGRGLQSGVEVQVQERGGHVVGRIGVAKQHPAHRYAKVHEEGMTIRARRKPFLVFQLSDGTWRRARQVTIAARSYLRSSLTEKERDIKKLYGTRVARALNKARFK